MRRAVVGLLPALLLAACGEPQSMLEGAGAAAEGLSNLSWLVLLLFSAVAAAMFVLILWIVLRRRGSFDWHESLDAGGGQSWILVGGFAVPFVILSFVFVLGLRAMSQFPLHGSGDNVGAPEIRVTGHQWWWQVDYISGSPHEHFATANEIHIPTGRPVDIELKSADVIHSFWVPRLHGKVDLVPGLSNRIRVIVERPGVYRGQCAEFCGAQHSHMRLLVVAQPEEQYDEWRLSQRWEASEPSNASTARGKRLFEERACALCHTIRGTRARGGVAPDLTHLASRRGLAANMLDFNKANLAAWVTHAQSLKPGAEMPDLFQFSGEELRDLIAYLEQLE